MKTFEVGKKYFDTSACDHNCVYTVEVVKRTAKTVTFRRNGQERRAKIYTDRDGEYIIPDRYSMAPVFRACREYTVEAVEVETGIRPASSTLQPQGDTAAVLAVVGQRVVCNCGAMSPQVDGVITGFVDLAATRWTPAAAGAAIRWDDGRAEVVNLSDIHPDGWRSPNGSPLGVFFAR